jgi:hypothetical protein
MADISALAVQFYDVFGVKLAKYWLGPYRLDITKFDDEVIKSGDRSMKDVIREKYGQGAVELIEALL